MIEFTEDGETYSFDPGTAESDYHGESSEMVSVLGNIESMAYKLVLPEEDVDDASGAPTDKEYDPEEAEQIVRNTVETLDNVSLVEGSGSIGSSEKNAPQVVEGPLNGSDTRVKEHSGFILKDGELVRKQEVPDSAEHISPDEEPPEGAATFTGPRGGTYAIMPSDLADELGEDVTVEDIEEYLEENVESDGLDSPAASDKVPPEDREKPDGVSGPIEEWDPDDVEEMVTPNMRFAEIGSDAHPLFWSRPESDEMDEFVEGVREDEEWKQGSDAFDKSFLGDDDTENEYTDEDGNWDEERLEQHDEWTDDLLNPEANTEEGEEPVGMVVLGPPGAGKGWWQEQVESGQYGDDLNEREFTHVNSDETKEPIPEYTGTNSPEVHEEASKMASDDLAPKTINEKQHTILDKVATTPDSMIETVSKMQENGYDIRASFVDVPEEKAAHNAVSRFYQEGRFTPFDYLLDGGPGEGDSARDGSKNSFETLIEEFDIPEEKVGRFNNDVEWGNAPDAEQVGEELLKTILEFYGFELAKKYAQ